MESHYFPCGFKLNSVKPAVVSTVKKDRVRFSIQNLNGKECDAWYFIHGLHLNLHKIFKKGETIDVRIICINTSCHHNIIEVRPEVFPVDNFIKKTPIGSEVIGKIIAVKGSSVFIEIAENVVGQAKKFYNAHIGMNVDCRLTRYNAHKKALFLNIIY